jgi:hypothetical protein
MLLQLAIGALFLTNSISPPDLIINFGNYFNAPVNDDCSFTADGIPFKFYDIYMNREEGGRLVCEGGEELNRAFKGKVQREDLPIDGKKVEVSIAEIDCLGVEDLFEYELFYQNGEVVRGYGLSLVIKQFHRLDYLTFTEMECGLTGKKDRISPMVLEFRVLR